MVEPEIFELDQPEYFFQKTLKKLLGFSGNPHMDKVKAKLRERKAASDPIQKLSPQGG